MTHAMLFALTLLSFLSSDASAAVLALQSPVVRIKRNLPGNPQCLDVDGITGGSHTNKYGTPLVQFLCARPDPSGFSSQDFYLQKNKSGYTQIKLAISGSCLEVRGSQNGAPVQHQACRDTTNQGFDLISVQQNNYQIRARHSGRCLEIPARSPSNGVAVQQFDCVRGKPSQVFTITESY